MHPIGKRLKCIQPYKATNSEEASISIDDLLEVDSAGEDRPGMVHVLNCSWNERSGTAGWVPTVCLQEEETVALSKTPEVLAESSGADIQLEKDDSGTLEIQGRSQGR